MEQVEATHSTYNSSESSPRERSRPPAVEGPAHDRLPVADRPGRYLSGSIKELETREEPSSLELEEPLVVRWAELREAVESLQMQQETEKRKVRRYA